MWLEYLDAMTWGLEDEFPATKRPFGNSCVQKKNNINK
jgi:hypothetical protein